VLQRLEQQRGVVLRLLCDPLGERGSGEKIGYKAAPLYASEDSGGREKEQVAAAMEIIDSHSHPLPALASSSTSRHNGSQQEVSARHPLQDNLYLSNQRPLHHHHLTYHSLHPSTSCQPASSAVAAADTHHGLPSWNNTHPLLHNNNHPSSSSTYASANNPHITLLQKPYRPQLHAEQPRPSSSLPNTTRAPPQTARRVSPHNWPPTSYTTAPDLTHSLSAPQHFPQLAVSTIYSAGVSSAPSPITRSLSMAAHGFSTDELARMQELSNTWEPEATVISHPISLGIPVRLIS
jgi:hypothetical protein